MNILPHKSWHVRNKDNIERVRRDEEKAAQEEKERKRRIALAEQEARTELLRKKARSRRDRDEDVEEAAIELPSRHINFFSEQEEGKKSLTGTNKDYEAEKKAEKEKQERSIGLLTYLGESAVEAQTSKPWYFAPPKKKSKEESEEKEEEDFKRKTAMDPMKKMMEYVEKKKHKKHKEKEKKHKKHKHKRREDSPPRKFSSKSIEQLRSERLLREQQERLKTEKLLAKMKGEKDPTETVEYDDRKRTYNSQFNPEFVRKPKKKREFQD